MIVTAHQYWDKRNTLRLLTQAPEKLGAQIHEREERLVRLRTLQAPRIILENEERIVTEQRAALAEQRLPTARAKATELRRWLRAHEPCLSGWLSKPPHDDHECSEACTAQPPIYRLTCQRCGRGYFFISRSEQTSPRPGYCQSWTCRRIPEAPMVDVERAAKQTWRLFTRAA